MAVTHADLSVDRGRSNHGGKLGAFLVVLAILCGLSCFILSLLAEAMRSEATWVISSGDKYKYECYYSGSGRTPLLCALGAFVTLACAMVLKHAYILVAVSRSEPPALISWAPHSTSSKLLTWQACFFFAASWICFAVGEVLLMIGIGVESGHLKNRSGLRPTCLVIQQGMFAAAGIFGLTTVFLAAGLYLTALRAQRLQLDEDNVRREVLEASFMYSSPVTVRSPRHTIPTATHEISPARQERATPSARENPTISKSSISAG